MKKISIAVVILIGALSAMAQENKPTQGCFGIGYVVGFLPTQQNVGLTYFVSNSLEVGGFIGFQYNRNRNSTFDSLVVEGTNFTSLAGQEEDRTVTTTATVFITPVVKYHFNVKNNLDVYAGGALPIGITPGTKTVTSDIITASSYNSTAATTTTSPVTVSVGAGVLLGCQYFFYKNLALGAMANLGFTASIQNGNDKTVNTESNTGSNNPNTGTTIPAITTKQEVKNDSEGLGMLHSFDLSLTWYFGNAGK